jgi:Alginate lyase
MTAFLSACSESAQGGRDGSGGAGGIDAGIGNPDGPPGGGADIQYPAQVLDLSNWKLTLPIDTPHAGSPDEIQHPELATFVLAPYFMLDSAKDGVTFAANCGGATTSGSGYPRSELREMTTNGTTEAAWSNSSGTHTMIVREAITHLPVAKPHVVAGQIHDASDDVIEVRLEGTHLFVDHNGTNYGDLNASYALGTIFTLKIVAGNGNIDVYYDDVLKVHHPQTGSGWYYKAGAYTQSNTSKGDAPDAYGEVIIYALQVTHS